MSRLESIFSALAERGEKAMGLFVTNGFPNPDATVPILHAIDRGGADFIELGMPFSDPLAEGKPIQRSSAQALKHGVSLEDSFKSVSQFREQSETPLLLMGYLNPILRFGVEQFCEKASASGVDGLILPDLPPAEASILKPHAQQHGLDLVFLIAPNSSDERIQQIDNEATGFVYAVSITGLTGSEVDAGDPVQHYLQRAKKLVRNNPLLVGFGIRSHADAMKLSQHTDGFIVGSALINRIEQLWGDDSLSEEARLAHVQEFAAELKGHSIPAN